MEKKTRRGPEGKKIMGEDVHGINPPVFFESCSEASRQTGIPASNICACANGRLKTAGHYKWTYITHDNAGPFFKILLENIADKLNKNYLKKEHGSY